VDLTYHRKNYRQKRGNCRISENAEFRGFWRYRVAISQMFCAKSHSIFTLRGLIFIVYSHGGGSLRIGLGAGLHFRAGRA
jgi:hypothetical protein